MPFFYIPYHRILFFSNHAKSNIHLEVHVEKKKITSVSARRIKLGCDMDRGYTCKRIDAVETERKEGKKIQTGKVMICVNETTSNFSFTWNTIQNGMKWYSRMTLTILSIEREHERELDKRLILIELHGIWIDIYIYICVCALKSPSQGLRCASHFNINNFCCFCCCLLIWCQQMNVLLKWFLNTSNSINSISSDIRWSMCFVKRV